MLNNMNEFQQANFEDVHKEDMFASIDSKKETLFNQNKTQHFNNLSSVQSFNAISETISTHSEKIDINDQEKNNESSIIKPKGAFNFITKGKKNEEEQKLQRKQSSKEDINQIESTVQEIKMANHSSFEKSSQVSNSNDIKSKCMNEFSKTQINLIELYCNVISQKNEIRILKGDMINNETILNCLIEKENKAIENNNFEEAQDIENQCDLIKEKNAKLQKRLNQCNNELIQLKEKEILYFNLKIRANENACNSFEILINSHQNDYNTFISNDINRHKSDNIKIKKMKEKLEILCQDLETNKENLLVEQNKVDSLIKSQSSGIFEDLEKLNEEKNCILQEIEEIKALLAKKHDVLDKLAKEIESKEVEIDAIKSNFKHEFKKLNYKSQNYEESKKDYEEQKKELHAMMKLYDENEKKNTEKIKTFETKIEELKSDSEGYHRNKELNLTVIETLSNLMQKENELKSNFSLIEMKFEQSKRLIDSNINNINLLQLNIKKLEGENVGMDMKIPALEEDKAKYIAGKKFKDAGKVANELKAIFDQKEINLRKIQENKMKIEEYKIENEKNFIDMENYKKEMANEQINLDCTSYEYLLLYRQNLINLIEELNSNKTHNMLENLKSGLEKVSDEIFQMEQLSYIKKKYARKLSEQSNKSDAKSIKNSPVKSSILNNSHMTNDNVSENLPFPESIETEVIGENIDKDKKIILVKLKDLNKDLDDLNKNQENALADEDYEKADELQQLIDEVQKEIEDFKLKINYNFEDEEDADAKHNSFERPKSTIKDKFIDITPCEDKKSESIQNSPRSFDKDMSERKSQEI